MNVRLPSRRLLLIFGSLLLGVALAAGLPWLSPTRGVERAWQGTLRSLEKNDFEAFSAYLDSNYRDGFGLDREGVVTLARTVRGQFFICTITREQSEIVLDPDKQVARSRALIRLGGQGSPVATAAIQASATTTLPTLFRWRRASWKPWDWLLVGVDNAEAAKNIAQLERQASGSGLSLP